MAINPVSSSTTSTIAALQQQGQTGRAREVEGDNDKDDGASRAAAQQNTAAQSAPAPTVNTSGQIVGSIINTQA